MFFHTHLVNGHVIIHSHPFKVYSNNKTPFQPHKHTSFAYNLIQYINKINWEDTSVAVEVPDPFVSNYVLTSCYIWLESDIESYFSVHLRAPPIV